MSFTNPIFIHKRPPCHPFSSLLSPSHTHCLCFSRLRCLGERMSARQCQSTDACSRQSLTNRGCRLVWCPPHPPPPTPSAPPHSAQATGSWEEERPTDQQLLGLWLSDWPGCCTPPSPRSGHLTMGKLTNAWPLGAPADGRRVSWPYCTGRTHTHTHTRTNG